MYAIRSYYAFHVLDNDILEITVGRNVPAREAYEDRCLDVAQGDVGNAHVFHEAAVDHFERDAGQPGDRIRHAGELLLLPVPEDRLAAMEQLAVLNRDVAEAAISYNFV